MLTSDGEHLYFWYEDLSRLCRDAINHFFTSVRAWMGFSNRIKIGIITVVSTRIIYVNIVFDLNRNNLHNFAVSKRIFDVSFSQILFKK